MVWPGIETTASVATAISVILLLYQIILNGRRATTRFENELVGEYRNVMNELPLEALLGEKLSKYEYEQNLSEFYRYIDLSNEQIFLRQEKQVSESTWENWRQGIESNFSKPAFRKAWCEVKQRSDSFCELRKLENEDFDTDPALWSDTE
jgi:hypothetical protein